MYNVYKDNNLLFKVDEIVKRGDAWSFENTKNDNIKQELVTTNIEMYTIKNSDGEVVVFRDEISVVERNRADIDYLSIMQGVDLI